LIPVNLIGKKDGKGGEPGDLPSAAIGPAGPKHPLHRLFQDPLEQSADARGDYLEKTFL
jgi:hypothetical protein